MSIDSSFSLSIDNLKQIPFEKYDNKFTFIVNGKRYETSRFIADLLSPIIREYHYSDETKTEYILKTKIDVQEQLNGDDYFTDFLNLTSFDTKNLNSNQKLYFSNYFLQLGNINEYLLLQLLSVNEEISPNNVISRLKFLTDQLTIQSIQLSNSKIKEILNQLIEYISSNFDSISKEEMKQLDSETIELIISNPSLKLSEEDTLLNFILDLYKTDTKNSFFFEYVLFNNVSETSLTKFIKIFNIEDINSRIWSSICRRILPSQSKCQNEEGRYNDNFKTFSYEKGKEFQGIMRFLSKETGGNIHDNGTIEITTKSNTSNSKYLVDYEKDNFFNSNSPKDEEIRFDFKERRIQLSSYLIQSHKNGKGDGKTSNNGPGHLRNWVIEVSNDGKTWKIIDRHENDSTLNGSSIIANFDIKSKSNDFYRFVKLRTTGLSWYGDDRHDIFFPFIEFYGKMKEQ